jgi:hypothetical protein
MSSTRPDETTSYPAPGTVAGARMPIPGNAELAIFLFVWLVLVIIWAAADAVNSFTFSWLTVVLAVGYMLSRGIAKASRVLEQ